MIDIKMVKNLTETEVKKRLQKLNNYEKIKHPQLKERSDKLREKVKTLEAQNAKIPVLEKQIETQKLRIEELEAMKFGKKRRNKKTKAVKLPNKEETCAPKKREKSSYRRAVPKAEKITDELKLSLEICPECGKEISDRSEHIHYREDLKEAQETIKNAQKIVKIITEKGICKNKDCEKFGKQIYAGEIPPQTVTIGENVRRMVVFSAIKQGQSYQEISENLGTLYDFKLSSGQITKILHGESILFTPYYNYLVQELDRESKEVGAHYDETGYRTQSQGAEISDGNYCWVKISAKSEKQLIWFGQSRGKKVAERLRGERGHSVGISDDYGGYHDLFEHHQLCWAHPHRKLRDLSESQKIRGSSKESCDEAFKKFREIYSQSEKSRKKILSRRWDDEKKSQERKRLEKLWEKLIKPGKLDPEKLEKIKKSLEKKRDKYFTFFDQPKIPLDNNKAERALRKVVIRRKKTMGCKSPKGADVLSILYSVIFSLMEQNPGRNFFELYDFAVGFKN